MRHSYVFWALTFTTISFAVVADADGPAEVQLHILNADHSIMQQHLTHANNTYNKGMQREIRRLQR